MRAYFLIVVGIVAGAGCATSPQRNAPSPAVAPGDVNSVTSPGDAAFDELEEEFAQREVTIADPLEPVNRIMYGFNDAAYFWVVRPVTHTYADVTPRPVRIGIGNFFQNVATPPRVVNCLLQGKGPAVEIELRRFVINTTAGVLGFGDPARDRWGLEPAEEDLGQTLAVYGLGDGFYLVWPLLGPSTLRDSAGMVGDQFLNPIRYVEPTELSIGLSVANTVNERSWHRGEYETFKAAAVDPYVAMRGAYVQYRKKQIRGEDHPADPNSDKPQAKRPGEQAAHRAEELVVADREHVPNPVLDLLVPRGQDADDERQQIRSRGGYDYDGPS
jgi:phospholipid-binding lipoprotein MlaA